MPSKESLEKTQPFCTCCSGLPRGKHGPYCTSLRVADLLDEAIREGFQEGVDASADVIDREIKMRELFDEHMEPIDKLAKQIRDLAQLRESKP